MYKVHLRGLVAPGGVGDLGAFLARGRIDLKLPWSEFGYGGYSVAFWND